MEAIQYKIETLVKDPYVKQTLRKALADDGILSFDEVKEIVASTLDRKGVSIQEFKDLQAILKNSKTIDIRARQLIQKFCTTHYRPAVIASASDQQLAKNFKLSEFSCKDGTVVPKELYSNVNILAENLQVLRDKVKTAIRINSSYRTKSHNDKVGGSLTSQHLVAKAADIVIPGLSPIVVKSTIEKLIKDKKMLQGGIGLYNSFVHYDIRGTRTRW